MKSLKAKFRKSDAHEWSKNDDRLLQAVEHGDTEKVAALLGKKGISPTKLDSEGKSAFHLAATKGHVECLGAMLTHGVDLTVPDGSGYNALHLASKNSHQECVKKILQASLLDESGKKEDQRGWKQGLASMVLSRKTYKCPVECADSNGKTALHHAAGSGSISIVQLLCEHKCPINIKDTEGFTPLIQAAQSNHAEVCHYLIDQGADIDARDKNGRTAVMLACENGSGNAVEMLVKRGANLKLVDALGHDALHYYKLSGNADVLKFLQATLKKVSEDADMKSAQTSKQLEPAIKIYADRSGTPKKRKAPPPPTSVMQGPQPSEVLTPESHSPRSSEYEPSKVEASSVKERENNEEMRKLQAEKANLLEMIQNLNQQLRDKNSQEAQQNNLKRQDCRNSEEVPFDAIGSGSKKTEVSCVEEPDQIRALQSRIASLAVQNKELWDILQGKHSQDKVTSILSQDEQSRQNLETSFDLNLNSDDSHCTLKADYIQLKELYKNAEAEITNLRAEMFSNLSNSSLQTEVFEHGNSNTEAKDLHDQESQHALAMGLLAEFSEESLQTLGETNENGYYLEQKLRETQSKYDEALKELSSLRAQVQQDLSFREEHISLPNLEALTQSYEDEIEELKQRLKRSLEDEERANNNLREMEELLEIKDKILAKCMSEEECEELKNSQSLLIENISQEKALLIEKYEEAQEEIKKLQEKLNHQASSQGKENYFQEMVSALKKTVDELNNQLTEITQQYNEAQSELKKLKDKRAEVASEHVNSNYIHKEQHEQLVQVLNESVDELKEKLSEMEMKLKGAEQDNTKLERDLEVQKQTSVSLSEHTQIIMSLENTIKTFNGKVRQMEQGLEQKEIELNILQGNLATEKAAVQEAMVPKSEYEKLKVSLEAESNRLTAKINDLLKEQEKASAEAAQARKDSLLTKSERDTAQTQLGIKEQEIKRLRIRSHDMQQAIEELQKQIKDSLKLEEDKDKKNSELSKEVSKLKEALNSLSQLSYTASTLKRQNQQLETLQQQVKHLQHQLSDASQRHQEVVSVYRMHLLYAVQGQMDEDVQKALKQILTMCKTQTQMK
ncbi:ankycorbin isoform X1 [Carcharodon carcharias]|uniref:ankycorbin isoform X1 n=1 Tax=Carcharodon carcharias TaxID=13397 RepID=UPI001B7E6766|nr:ankycorbin isoform X1 [Carcharodon carcharias]XP_041050145.1 ankycorbin isoform X1 [Carcharodon carcharias]